MTKIIKSTMIFTAVLLLLNGCTANRQVQAVKYPSKPAAASSDRKSGPAMIFLEAAEEAADPNNVEVLPPRKN